MAEGTAQGGHKARRKAECKTWAQPKGGFQPAYRHTNCKTRLLCDDSAQMLHGISTSMHIGNSALL